jgi:hypothetical protein
VCRCGWVLKKLEDVQMFKKKVPHQDKKIIKFSLKDERDESNMSLATFAQGSVL